MTHLVPHVHKACTGLKQEASERVTQIMEPESLEARLRDYWQEITLYQIVWIQNRAIWGWKNEVVQNVCFPSGAGFAESKFTEFEQYRA